MAGSATSFAETPVERLARLYPQLSAVELREKIRVARTPFDFYRSFVALFYDELASNASISAPFSPVRSDLGVCIGDAHPENFGVVLNDRAESTFTINDVDDVAPGPIYTDLLRFLAGISVYAPTTPLVPLVQTYLNALQGRMPPVSALVSDAITESQSKNFAIARKELRSETELKRPSDAIELNDAEKNELRAALAPIGLTLIDTYRYKRLKGGSYGTWRIPTLVQSAPSSAWGGRKLLVEFKQIFPSSLRALVPPASIPNAWVRIPPALALFQRPAPPSQIFRVTSLQGSDFLIRPRWTGNVDVELDDWANHSSPTEMLALYHNEAAVIGRIHREGAAAPRDYINRALQIAANDWVNAAQALAASIRATYQAVRGP